MPRLTRAAGALLAAFVLGCAAPRTVRTQAYPTDTTGLDVRKVAIAPFRPADSYVQASEVDPPGAAAAALIERFVSEALAVRGVEVVPAGDVRQALRLDETAAPPPLGIVAQVAHREFGVQAVLHGTVYRIRERTGEALAAAHPASVWFEVTLIGAPTGARLWKAVFNETQQPLNENLLNARRYPGGGTRWLRAEELARWGAEEIAREFPVGGGGQPGSR
jgi:hypothetical protein